MSDWHWFNWSPGETAIIAILLVICFMLHRIERGIQSLREYLVEKFR